MLSVFPEIRAQGYILLICFNLTALLALDNMKHLICVIYMNKENTIHCFSDQEQCSLHMALIQLL